MSGVGLNEHITVDGIDQDEDGWYRAVCECGYVAPPMPDVETLVDDLMQHVSLAVQTKLREDR